MIDWLFYGFIISVVIYLVGTIILIADIGKNYPEFYEELDGLGFFFNLFKQMDFLFWIITRRYMVGTSKGFHKYDLYLGNLIVVIVLFILWGGLSQQSTR
jgi:hypothetical protein